MKNEEKLYQIGSYLLTQKAELKQTANRQTKAYNSDGVFDGSSDDFGFDRRFFGSLSYDIEHPIIYHENSGLDFDLLTNKLISKGKQKVFFSCVNQDYSKVDTVIKYGYGNVTKLDYEYFTRHKKIKYTLEMDQPFLFDCSDSVRMLASSYLEVPPNDYWSKNGLTWSSTTNWATSPPYQAISAMTASQVISNFADWIEDGKGYLFLDDQFYFTKFIAPDFTANDFTKSITNWSNFGNNYQASFNLDTIKLNGSMDNFCFILQSDISLAPNQFIEIINETNLSGIRLENISNQVINGFNYYNHLNRSVYTTTGQKLNSSQLQVAITVPDNALDHLLFNSNLGEYHNLTLYPSLKIVTNSNQNITIKLKNQRVYA